MFTASLNFEGLQAMISSKDPVCGMELEAAKAAGASTYEGKTFYFCAEGCKKKFDASPKKYVAKE